MSPLKQKKSEQDGLIYLAKEQSIQIANEQAEKLILFLDLIQKWNKVHNLTAITNREDMLVKHILDSLSILPELWKYETTHNFRKIDKVLDIGSGAGLPGIPAAIIEAEREWVLVDASSKRVAFINEVKRQLKLDNVFAHHSRIEEFNSHDFKVITCRAFSSLKHMVEKSSHLLAQDGCWLAMKGIIPEDEIKELPDSVKVEEVTPLLVPNLNAERHLLKLMVSPSEQ